MNSKKPVRGLGRGLDALLPLKQAASPESPVGTPSLAGGDDNHDVFLCPVEKIRPQSGQPRKRFDADRIDELASSIREHGLIEPIIVRRSNDDSFVIVAGERRWRAAQRAGLHELQVVVRDVSPDGAYELALIENIQREDLDPIEFSEALDHLIKEHGYSQDSLAQRVGKDRSTIANALRLLRLPTQVRARVVSGELSEGHARALLGAPDEAAMMALAERVVTGRLSVRQTELLVRQAKSNKTNKGPPKPAKTASVRDLEKRLERKLGTPISVRDRDGKGDIVVHYGSWDELDRILELIL